MREALLFCFNFRSHQLPNRIECLWRPMATMLYRKQHAEIGFAGSMMTILIWVTRSEWKSAQEGWGRLNCRLFWTRTIPNRIKWLLSNWVFLKQTFPCGYMPWGRFKRSKNGCRINWTIGRWSDAKTHPKFCLPDKRKSFLYRIVTGDEKWIYFQNPKRKKSWVDPAQPSTSCFCSLFLLPRKKNVLFWLKNSEFKLIYILK